VAAGPPSGATGERFNVLAAIRRAAGETHTPYDLDVAIAEVESGLDPNAEGDYVNGNPTSFGLYQLHIGGLLGGLSPQQAKDPYTNAYTDLTHLGEVIRANPGITDPGTLAAISQNPKDKIGYAAKVNAKLKGGNSIVNGVTGAAGDVGGFLKDAAGGVWGAATFIPRFLARLWNLFTNSHTWIRIGMAIGGFALLLIGLKLLVTG